MIPAILEHSASSVQPISLRIRGVSTSFSGQISGQRIISALAFAFSRPLKSVVDDAFYPASEENLHWQPGYAELEGRALSISVAHGTHASYFKSAAAEFWVAANGDCAELTRCEGEATVWLFGPMLILALAHRQIFCLHASAATSADGALVLIGASGAGKSTFAAAALRATAATRLCDDISPIGWLDNTFCLLPQFPQLKLVNPDSVPESVRLKALVYLQAASAGHSAQITPLTGNALHRQLLGHTVGSRLFRPRDCQAWWAVVAQWCSWLEGRAFVLRPAYNAQTPDRAMLEALSALTPLLR